MSTRHTAIPWHESPACVAARALRLLRVGDACRWSHTFVAHDGKTTTHVYRLEYNDFEASGSLQQCYVLTRDAVPVWRSADREAIVQQLLVLGFLAPVRVRTYLIFTLRNERLRALPWLGRSPLQMSRLVDDEQRRDKRNATTRAYRQRKRAAAQGAEA